MPTYGEEATIKILPARSGYYLRWAITPIWLSAEAFTRSVRGGVGRIALHQRYKYSGSFNMQYSNIKTGEKGEPDYIKQSNFRISGPIRRTPRPTPVRPSRRR